MSSSKPDRARPVEFPEQTAIIPTPVNMSAEDVPEVPVYANGGVIVCCWQFTKDELEEIMETGCAWVAFPGQRLPQHRLHGNRPFEQQTEEAGPEAVADPLETVPPDYDAIVQHFMQAVPDNPTLAEGAAYEFYEKGNEAEWKHSNGKQWNVRKEADKYIKTKKEQ